MNEQTQYQLFRYLHERGEMSAMERFDVSVGLVFSAAQRSEYRQMAQMHRDLTVHFTPGGAVAVPVSLWLSSLIAVIAVSLLISGMVFSAKRAESTPAKAPAKAATSCGHCSGSAECEQCLPRSPAASSNYCP